MSNAVPRTVRYQIARFCDWLPMKREAHIYKVTPSSLERAKEQGLETKQLLALLTKHSSADMPPNLTRALNVAGMPTAHKRALRMYWCCA